MERILAKTDERIVILSAGPPALVTSGILWAMAGFVFWASLYFEALGVLVAFLVPVLPAALLNAAAAVAALALAWSFGRDIRLLMSQTE